MRISDILGMIFTLILWASLVFLALKLIPMDDEDDSDDKGNT